jgi:hypothetical protein
VNPRAASLALLAALVLAEAGCATIQFGGGLQKIRVESDPPGALVTVLPDVTRFTTPVQMILTRREARTIRIELDGYCRETVYIDRVASLSSGWPLFFSLGLAGVGLWVDTHTGAAYTLRPDKVQVHLWPIASPDRECGPASSMPRTTPLPPTEPL